MKVSCRSSPALHSLPHSMAALAGLVRAGAPSSERWAPSPSWCAVVEGLDVGLQQLSAPSAPSCSDLYSTAHTWSTMTALHPGIFHFLFSVTLHSSLPPHNSSQTNGNTSGALQLGDTHTSQWHNSTPGISGPLPWLSCCGGNRELLALYS